MGKEDYNFLFEQKENNVATSVFSRPIMKLLNTFGRFDIMDIRDKHNQIGFSQTYMYDVDKKTLALAYIPKDPEGKNWEFFRESVLKNKRFVEEFKINNSKYVFIVSFPKVWHHDFDMIVEGKYSKVSEEYLNQYYQNKASLLFHLSKKTQEAVSYYSREFNVSESIFNDCEIGPRIDLNTETFKLNMTSVF
jgi:hypothetical protein